MSIKLNTRAIAAKLSWQIIDKGNSLDAALKTYFASHSLTDQDRGLVQELVYGVCRWYGELDCVASNFLAKPIRNKDRVIHFVLMVGLYQLRYISTAEHAAVAETVAACQQLQKGWAKNLINGCLRNYLRSEIASKHELSNADQQAHPTWIVDAIKYAWPSQADAIFKANNQRSPMCLRVNRRVNSRATYLDLLCSNDIPAKSDPYCSDGIILDTPIGVTHLPNFLEGAVSIQDTAAQIACDIINIKPGQTVLDACAAPGGKTAHMLERSDNQLTMHALDISETRCEQLDETLERLKLKAETFIADASQTPTWPIPIEKYNRILIDAPCSGIGVIRRHPDIKHHRRVDDIKSLNKIQQQLLQQLWKLLKPDGLLLYMTCSILPTENQQQINDFLDSNKDAQLADFDHPNALDLEIGKQTLPGIHDMDGFYYCLLQKTNGNVS